MTKRLKEWCQFAEENRKEFQIRVQQDGRRITVWPLVNEKFMAMTLKTAETLKEKLQLVYKQGWEVYPRTDPGGYVYTFPEYS